MLDSKANTPTPYPSSPAAICACLGDGRYGEQPGIPPSYAPALKEACAVHGLIPAYDADGLTLYRSACLDVLPRLPAESVNEAEREPRLRHHA